MYSVEIRQAFWGYFGENADFFPHFFILSGNVWYDLIKVDFTAADKSKHHPGYEKTSDMYSLLKDKMGEAIANAEKLEGYNKAEEHQHPDVNCNPYTDVHRLVKLIIE